MPCSVKNASSLERTSSGASCDVIHTVYNSTVVDSQRDVIHTVYFDSAHRLHLQLVQRSPFVLRGVQLHLQALPVKDLALVAKAAQCADALHVVRPVPMVSVCTVDSTLCIDASVTYWRSLVNMAEDSCNSWAGSCRMLRAMEGSSGSSCSGTVLMPSTRIASPCARSRGHKCLFSW